MTRKGIAKLALTLFVITAVTAVLLGVVNAVTADKIAEINAEKTADAMSKVILTANRFEESVSADDYVIYTAWYGNTVMGYVVQVEPTGFGGAIDMVVGFDAHGRLTGVEIISMSETAGVGDKAVSEKWFLNQFKGSSAGTYELAMDWDVDAISGATVTSKAVLKGVNLARSAISQEGLA